MKGYNPKTITIIWDYDGPIGQINSSFPYNFNASVFDEENNNIFEILDILRLFNFNVCFAITGFSAEYTSPPFMIRDSIKAISNDGHEIASHSWKHENLTKLLPDQIFKSLQRSKRILEEVSGKEVIGFVPPHNRPMTWLRKGRFSLGDNRIFPFKSTGEIGGVLKMLNKVGYKWIRISGRNLFHQIKGTSSLSSIIYEDGLTLFDQHCCGFDIQYLKRWLNSSSSHLTISAHPLMWNRSNKLENKDNFLFFAKEINNLITQGIIELRLPSSFV